MDSQRRPVSPPPWIITIGQAARDGSAEQHQLRERDRLPANVAKQAAGS
ncbi:hypothetical protein HNR02_004965 [Amycolatopsis endophytica]|uniref:Uncharacterized protein n=1 Tax=Amycolatopsis endophytica TaxID=860233 RepID=A0A853BA65_9PSEU|nr:hypothetical protein [Amycolatopsis endophytica]NYI91642.1 hypothetical protein [Amycolatopsis endophytica]